MVEKRVVVKLQTGLHARPAALFVQEANKYASEIFVQKGDKKVNAKSIMDHEPRRGKGNGNRHSR